MLKGVLAGGVVGGTGIRLPVSLAGSYRDYSGKLLVTVQADGGWDVTCFCDPKTNTPDEPVISHWAETDETRWAGNLPYAPFADNEAFFERHHSRMLVVNGVDMQNNSHDMGAVNISTGRMSKEFPTLSAVHAAPLCAQCGARLLESRGVYAGCQSACGRGPRQRSVVVVGSTLGHCEPHGWPGRRLGEHKPLPQPDGGQAARGG